MLNPTFIPSVLEKPRKRLIRKYHRFGSYHRLADALGVNVRYVYEFVINGRIPANTRIQRAMGIYLHKPVTINQLLQLPLQDQPPQILRLALQYREEIKT